MSAYPQIVLVTGASSGIGKATADLFAIHGFRVFGTSRHVRPSRTGVEMLCLDVQSDASVDRCIAEVIARAGYIHVLINNAGIEHVGMAEETAPEDVRAIFETNFFGAVRMCNAVLPIMRRQRRGRIINVGSSAAWVGEPGEAFYAASKSALSTYSEALRYEVLSLGVAVSLVEPGAFQTNILRSAADSGRPIADYNRVRTAVSALEESMRHGGDPSIVARTILKAVTARAPRRRYGVGREAAWLPYLKVLLPQWMFERLVLRGFGLPSGVGD